MLKQLIERPIAVTTILIAVVILGSISTWLLPVSLIPDMDIPYITVQVSYPRQSARELEESVISPLRVRLLQIEGLKDIQSKTRRQRNNHPLLRPRFEKRLPVYRS